MAFRASSEAFDQPSVEALAIFRIAERAHAHHPDTIGDTQYLADRIFIECSKPATTDSEIERSKHYLLKSDGRVNKIIVLVVKTDAVFGIRAGNDNQGHVFQEEIDSANESALECQLSDRIFILNHNEAPALTILRRWRCSASFQDSLDNVLRYGVGREAPDALTSEDRLIAIWHCG